MATGAKRPGRGFVVTGIVMMALAVGGTVVAGAVLGGSLDLGGFERDVVVDGASEVGVPGEIDFKVIEDIDDPQATMSVGVVANPDTGAVHNAMRCHITDSGGDEMVVRGGVESDAYTSAHEGEGGRPLVVAEDLPPGGYTAHCELSGEPVDMAGVEGTEVTFKVARVVTTDEVFDLAKPAFGILAAVVLGGLVGLVGLILMIVGLAVGNRARKEPPAPPAGHPHGYHPWR